MVSYKMRRTRRIRRRLHPGLRTEAQMDILRCESRRYRLLIEVEREIQRRLEAASTRRARIRYVNWRQANQKELPVLVSCLLTETLWWEDDLKDDEQVSAPNTDCESV